MNRVLTLALALAAVGAAGALPAAAQAAGEPSVQGPGPMAGGTARIQPGDQVSLRIVREPEMSGTFTVSAQGEVVLPRLGRVGVTDLSATELQDSLRRAYSTYLRDPAIEVAVLRRIGVHGEVHRPNVYMVDLTVTLRDLIALAGGVTQAGDPRNVEIVRGGERVQVAQGTNASFTTAELRSGDQVVVGRRSWVALNPAAALGAATGLISFLITTALLVK